MPQQPPVNILQTLQQAGFKGPGLARAWTHVMLESGGNPRAFNGNTGTGDRSWGLFQINTLGPLKSRVQQFGLQSEQDLLDPTTNAKVAFVMSKGGTDFGHWTGSREDTPKFKAMLAKFPGAKAQVANAGVQQAATQAWASGPAAVVAGPSPQQELAFRQQAAGSLIQLGQDIVRGGDPSAAMLAFQAIGSARMELRQAAQKAAASNASVAAYDGSTEDPAPGSVGAPNKQIATAIEIAKQQIGKPYVWGAESPAEGGFDCSGLLDYAFKKAGIKIPGRLTTYSAMRLGTSVRGQPMKPGDWIIGKGGTHMVMYIGNGQVIAAPRRGESVQYQPVSRFEGKIQDVRRLTPGKTK